MSDGPKELDRFIWETVVADMMDPMNFLSEEEITKLVVALVMGNHVAGQRETSQDGVERFLRWVAVQRAMIAFIENVLDGNAIPAWIGSATEPSFRLTKKGQARAEKITEQMGLPPLPEPDNE